MSASQKASERALLSSDAGCLYDQLNQVLLFGVSEEYSMYAVGLFFVFGESFERQSLSLAFV